MQARLVLCVSYIAPIRLVFCPFMPAVIIAALCGQFQIACVSNKHCVINDWRFRIILTDRIGHFSKMWKFWIQKDFIWDKVTFVGKKVPYWVPFSIKRYITLAIVMKILDFHQWFITFSEHLGYRIWSMSTAGKMCDFWSELKKITCQSCNIHK